MSIDRWWDWPEVAGADVEHPVGQPEVADQPLGPGEDLVEQLAGPVSRVA